MDEKQVSNDYWVPTMLTVRQCAQELRKIIKNDNLSEWFIRNLCKAGKVKCYMTGNKCLVDFDDLVKYLGGKKINSQSNGDS